jgi:hypothetical protein
MRAKRRSERPPKRDDEDASDQEYQQGFDPNSESFKEAPFDASPTNASPSPYLLRRNEETRTRITRNARVNYV